MVSGSFSTIPRYSINMGLHCSPTCSQLLATYVPHHLCLADLMVTTPHRRLFKIRTLNYLTDARKNVSWNAASLGKGNPPGPWLCFVWDCRMQQSGRKTAHGPSARAGQWRKPCRSPSHISRDWQAHISASKWAFSELCHAIIFLHLPLIWRNIRNNRDLK